jgi:hypothetical protein
MSGITLNTAFNNSDLPSADDIVSQIIGITGFLAWFQADTDHVSLVGSEISGFQDKGGGSGILTAYASTRRAVLTENAINNNQAALFSGNDLSPGSEDLYTLSGITLDANAAYTFAAIFKPTSAVGYWNGIIGRYISDSDCTYLSVVNNSSIGFRRNEGVLTRPVIADEWNIAIGGWTGTQAKLYANGVTASPVASTGTVTNATQAYVGAINANVATTLDGYLSDLLIFQADLFADADGLALVKGYAEQVYGLSV